MMDSWLTEEVGNRREITLNMALRARGAKFMNLSPQMAALQNLANPYAQYAGQLGNPHTGMYGSMLGGIFHGYGSGSCPYCGR